MRKGLVSFVRLPDFALWKRLENKRIPLSFELEITARCSNNCRHCYINLPPDDRTALRDELTLAEIGNLADQAVSLGSLWCLITGGEPLIREDFFDIYRLLKKKGLLVSVFTNACLMTEKHIKLFRDYPPRDVEVTVYGATRETYERVTRTTGSYAAFRRGLALLLEGGIQVDLKTMALRSNVHELPAIARFCRDRTEYFFRFDPILQLRFDGNEERNREIRTERLSAGEIVAIDASDPKRSAALEKRCSTPETGIPPEETADRLFQCGAGGDSFAVSYDGLFRLCPSLWQRDCLYDLRRGTLAEAWFDFVPRVLARTSKNREFLDGCRICPLMNQCQWCPAQAYLECGRMDEWCEYFCRVAHTRAEAFGKKEGCFHASVSLTRFLF
ncbi:MAG: radical SAM protein [Deltaproteobacteria bacterium]|nr:radical SAM protein [Deltaproteobacteria bacterium]